jgi:hypothetical protein
MDKIACIIFLIALPVWQCLPEGEGCAAVVDPSLLVEAYTLFHIVPLRLRLAIVDSITV